jgi:hypothetical protein
MNIKNEWPTEEEDLLTEGGGTRGAIFHFMLFVFIIIALIISLFNH